jgi:hypothetical protein
MLSISKTWGIYNWSLFEGVKVKVPQHLEESPVACRQEFHCCTNWQILCAKNSLGCNLNHCTTVSCISFFGTNIRLMMTFFNGVKTWKLWEKAEAVCMMPEHFPSYHVMGRCHEAGWCSQQVYPHISVVSFVLRFWSVWC